MGDLPISGLTAGSPALSTDLIPIAHSGTTFNVTAGSIANISGVTFGLTGPAWWMLYDGSNFPFTTAVNGAYGTGTGNQVRFIMIRITYQIAVKQMTTRALST